MNIAAEFDPPLPAPGADDDSIATDAEELAVMALMFLKTATLGEGGS